MQNHILNPAILNPALKAGLGWVSSRITGFFNPGSSIRLQHLVYVVKSGFNPALKAGARLKPDNPGFHPATRILKIFFKNFPKIYRTIFSKHMLGNFQNFRLRRPHKNFL